LNKYRAIGTKEGREEPFPFTLKVWRIQGEKDSRFLFISFTARPTKNFLFSLSLAPRSIIYVCIDDDDDDGVIHKYQYL